MVNCQKLEAESQRLLAEMDELRSRYAQVKKMDSPPRRKLLEQMAATSRRFREVSEQMLATTATDNESLSVP